MNIPETQSEEKPQRKPSIPTDPQHIETEAKLIGLALKHSDVAKELCETLKPASLDKAHRPLFEAIKAQGVRSKWQRTLTREMYQQGIIEARDKRNLVAKMTVHDKCSLKYAARKSDYDALLAKWREHVAGKVLRDVTQQLAENMQKVNYQTALAELARAVQDETIDATTGSLKIVHLSDVDEQAVEWLWHHRLARGKLSLFLGDPECGKSFASLSLAARITRGQSLPHDETGNAGKGDVLLLSSEDGVADTIKPRFTAQGGDPERLHVIQGRSDGAMFSLETDLPLLRTALEDYPETRLIIIDPLNAYLGRTDSYKDADVRRILSPLSDFGDATGIAVVGIMHMNKSKQGPALYRALGSIGFVAASRAAWLFVRDKDEVERVLVLQVKNNLAPNPGGLAFRIKDGNVQWENDIVETTATEALSTAALPRQQAREWLESVLADGPMNSKDIFELADKKGISARTLRRAKDELHIVPRKVVQHWEWELPDFAGGKEQSGSPNDLNKDEKGDVEWW